MGKERTAIVIGVGAAMSVLYKIAGLIKNFQNYLNSTDEKTFRRFALLFYSLLAAVNVLTHEMWADEMQAWMLAKDNRTLAELFSNFGYYGHPPLWCLMLYALTQVTHNPAAMQALHLAIAVASAYVFLRFAPFTRLQRLLFVFGYFPLYEYAAISRNYAIGVLLLFVICTVYHAGAEKKYLLLATLLFLLAQTSAYGFLLVVSIAGALTFEFLADKETHAYAQGKKMAVLLSICIVLAGLAVSAAVMKPAPDCGFASEWTTRFDIKRLQMTLATVWEGYIPLPRLARSFWNDNILPGRTAPSLLAAPLLCFVFLLFARKRMPLVLLGLSTCLILIFQYVKHIGHIRHSGHLFIIFIVCLWIEGLYRDNAKDGMRFLQNAADYCKKYKGAFLNALLVIHFAAGIHASVMEWLYPFSQASNTAAYIRENHLDKLPIAGWSDHPASAVAGYLGRQIYYVDSDRTGTFIIFDKQWATKSDESTMLQRAHTLADKEKSDVLLVLSKKLQTNDKSINQLIEFTGSFGPSEDYYLYLLRYQSQ